MLPFFREIISRLLQADTATTVALDTVQHFIDTRPLSQPAQLAREVLLQRLATLLGSALQRGVHILGDIPYQHVRHAYIMLSLVLVRNSWPRRAPVSLARCKHSLRDIRRSAWPVALFGGGL